MEIFKKLQKARMYIKAKEVKKLGYNTYSNYAYYTPEQVNDLTTEAANEYQLFNKYDLIKRELGLVGKLTIHDLESNEKIQFEAPTDVPEMKATNLAQQYGGAMTYNNRYLLMFAYDIMDNSLDSDAQDPKQFKTIQKQISEQLQQCQDNELVKTVKKRLTEAESTGKNTIEFYDEILALFIK